MSSPESARSSLRTVFVGGYGTFDEILVHWLSQRTDVVGVVWTRPPWKQTAAGKLHFARTRMRRWGMWHVLDEMAFYFYFHAFRRKHEASELRHRVIEPYLAKHGPVKWTGDTIQTTNVNSPEVLTFLRDLAPDVALAMCINNFFGEEFRCVPKHGVLLWHEGITPEYRGLYSPFWATYNLDFTRIGYTVLRMNDTYDAGEVFVQGQARDVNPFHQGHLYIGHKAIMDSLPEVEQLLQDLEAGTAQPIVREGAASHLYTYPGLTDLVRQRIRLRRLRRERLINGVPGSPVSVAADVEH